MKPSARFLAAAIIVAAWLVFGMDMKAQLCNAGFVNINNPSPVTVTVCLIGVGCRTIPPGLSVGFAVPVGTNVPGVVGASGTPYGWAFNPAPPPPFIITSIALPPTNQCFDVTYDPLTCTATVTLSGTGAPPCVNP